MACPTDAIAQALQKRQGVAEGFTEVIVPKWRTVVACKNPLVCILCHRRMDFVSTLTAGGKKKRAPVDFIFNFM